MSERLKRWFWHFASLLEIPSFYIFSSVHRREENPRDVASSMANGAIRRDPIAVKAGGISKQDRSARYAVLGPRCPRALLDQRGGEGRGGRRWG